MRYSDAHTDAAWFGLARELVDPAVVARFTIEGEPMSKARPRFGNGRTYTPEATVRAQAHIADQFRRAVTDSYRINSEATYGVTALFFHGTRQRRDVDNMIKLILDGLNGVAWEDDVQVVEVSGRKCLESAEHARTEVIVYLVGTKHRLTIPCEGCGNPFAVFPGNRRRFCSRKCAYAVRVKARPDCEVCGKPVKDMRSKTCSVECGGVRRGRAPSRCAGCSEIVSDHRKRLCRQCYLAGGVGYKHISPECGRLDHGPCPSCACVCHVEVSAS